MKSWVKNLILGVAIVGAGGFAIYRFVTVTAGPDFPKNYTIQGVCLACSAEAQSTQGLRERPPFECAKCKKAAVFPWYYCPDCKKRFVPAPSKRSDGVVRLPIVPTCPGCGGTRGATVDPLDPDEKPTGDLKLPALP